MAEGPVEKIIIAKEETVVAISATEKRLPAWVIEL